MRPIVLPKKMINKDISYLYYDFKSKLNNFDFLIDNRDLYKIFKIIETNNNYYDSIDIKKNLLYFLIRLCENNDIENPISIEDGGIPTNGIEFINQNTHDGLGIYHCHISNIDKGVLIWYVTYNDKNNLELKFEYLSPHPSDNYKSIFIKIYDNNMSFNLFTGKYLKDCKNLLNFDINEQLILKFRKFYQSSLEKNIKKYESFNDELYNKLNSQN